MKMNKKEEKLCRFLVTNKIADRDLTLDFDEGILMYKDYDGEYEELVIEDCDQYKLIIDWDGSLEVETPETEFNKDEYIKELERLVAKQSTLIRLLKNESPFNF